MLAALGGQGIQKLLRERNLAGPRADTIELVADISKRIGEGGLCDSFRGEVQVLCVRAAVASDPQLVDALNNLDASLRYCDEHDNSEETQRDVMRAVNDLIDVGRSGNRIVKFVRVRRSEA